MCFISPFPQSFLLNPHRTFPGAYPDHIAILASLISPRLARVPLHTFCVLLSDMLSHILRHMVILTDGSLMKHISIVCLYYERAKQAFEY